jgi:hypothetical protein
VDPDPDAELRAAVGDGAPVLGRHPAHPPGASGDRIIVGTHSGPIRVFAISAFGYDPGEPYNTEEVIVRLTEDGSAFIAYRNRVQEVQVPDLDLLPDWWEGLSGRALPTSLREEPR